MPLLFTLLLACAAEDTRTTLRQGPSGDDDPVEEEPAGVDTQLPEDTGDGPVDTGDPPEDTGSPGGTDEVCYPGPTGSWTVCFPTVAWSSSWGADYDYPEPYNGSAQYAKPVRYLDLSAVDAGAQLAENFVLDEFMQEYKGRYAIYMPHVVETLQEIRDQTGGAITVNSGYRNVTYNAGVGGAAYSRHMYGDSVDMKSANTSLSGLGAICETRGAGYVGYYETHVHCDWRNSPLADAFFGANFAAGSAPEPELSAELLAVDGRYLAPATGWDEGEPLRIWRAFDASGALIDEQVVREYEAPVEAVELEVVVGMEIALTRAL